MSVNTMDIEQIYSLLTSIHNQATGNAALAPIDTSSFISVAQATLQAGYDKVMYAITQVVGKTLIAVRPYSRKFKGLEFDRTRWGGIIRKISFADSNPQSDDTYNLGNIPGSVDQYQIAMPQALETRYVGSDVYQGSYTIFTKQLDAAFTSPEAFGDFMSGLMTHFSNEREQWLEDASRGILINAVTAKLDMNNGIIHLLTEYNAATGLSLTATTVRQPANFPAFCKWAYARIANVSQIFTERSGEFQEQIGGMTINRHTPVRDQRLYMNADFLEHLRAEVLADTYHNDLLTLADVEPVGYWQSIKSPLSVSNKPVYVDYAGDITTASANVANSVVLGVLFDRDAMGYNLQDDTLVSSPYNAAGQYYNLFSHVRIQLQNDFTEKVAVFCLD